MSYTSNKIQKVASDKPRREWDEVDERRNRNDKRHKPIRKNFKRLALES